MLEDLVLNGGLLLGGAVLAVWIGRALLFRFAPAWMVGPGGFLIDTTGRLGILQMTDDDRRHDPSWLRGGSDGGGTGNGGCG